METETKVIQFQDHVLIFKQTADGSEWYARLENFDRFREIECSVDLQHYFSDESWNKLPGLLEYLSVNLQRHVQNAIEPLTSFAIASGYFAPEEQVSLAFEFGHCIIIPDNTFTLNNRWSFELDYSSNSVHDDGRWLVSFDGNCICGIRREIW